MNIKTRFAPSPTGYLHIGSARTALYSYLYAKRHGGQFVLRIEDTDLERSTQASIDAILQGMEWLGLASDEGPYYQTKRLDRYQEVIEQLLASGHAYRCRCSTERLTELREAQLAAKQKPKYDGHCRELDLDASQPHVIRFKTPRSGEVSFTDSVRGVITVSNSELDDVILVRTDGMPTYNFSVVVDDMDMGITHVTRGDDHINNTPRQINIYHALNATPPAYAHLPMILGDDGKRLSKRHGAVSVMQYRDDGYLPEALLNYLVRLGWSHGDEEIFSVEEMIAVFNLGNISKSPASFNPEKLLWLNQHYLKTLPAEQIAEALQWHLQQQDIKVTDTPALRDVIGIQAERAKTLVNLAASSRYFYEDFNDYDEKAAKKNFKADTAQVLQTLLDGFNVCTNWQAEALHQVVHSSAETLDLKLGKVAQPLRVAVTGGSVSPSIDITLQLIGRQRVLARLEKAIAYCQSLA